MIKYFAFFKDGNRIVAAATILSDNFPLTLEEETSLKKEAVEELDRYIASRSIDRKLLLGPDVTPLNRDMYEYKLVWTGYER